MAVTHAPQSDEMNEKLEGTFWQKSHKRVRCLFLTTKQFPYITLQK